MKNGGDGVMRQFLGALTATAALFVVGTPAFAQAPCRTSGSFDQWLAQFEQQALAQGISRNAIAQATPYLTYDARIINIDRGQRVFAQSFLEFSTKMLPGGRISAGIAQIKKNAAIFAREEQQYGVPPAVIAGFWGLESDFGANMGKEQSIRSIATLAFDCRRSDMFRGQLFDALRLID